jgi:MFS superfamily sulfate permease-like transporter
MNLRNFWSSDFPASVVVFLVALPLCLGIALASGAPLFSGLIAGIIGGVVVGALSGSSVSVSGPAAGLTTIVAAAILDLGTFQAFLLSVVLAGLIQIGLGFAKAGSIGHFFPSSVIKGMLAAIGLILILKQLPHAFGYDEDFEGDESFFQSDGENTFTEILTSFDYLSPGAVVISVTCLLVLIIWNKNQLLRFRFFRLVPAPLGAVLIGILLNMLFNAYFPYLAIDEKHLVSVPQLLGSSEASSFFVFPDFSLWANPKIYIAAITIAIVASIETLLSIEACDKMDPYHHITPLNRELKAQGFGNIVAGLLGGLPVTSVIVRSSANINAGARTKFSAISHGLILLIALLTIPGFLNLIPLSCLAAILLLVGYKLTKFSLYKEMYAKGISQFFPFMITVVAILFTDLLKGVFLGIVVALFFILKTNFQRAVITVHSEDNYMIRFSKDVSFMHKASLRNALTKVPEDTHLVIDGSKAQFIDEDIMETIVDFIETGKSKHIDVELTGIKIKEKSL